MDSTTSHSCNVGDAYLYQTENQLVISDQLSSHSHPYTVTPPESLASGIRGFGHEDVGRLADVLEEGERLHHNADLANGEEADIKDVTLLTDTPPEPIRENLINICPNKISLCQGTPKDSPRVRPISAQMYLKDVMKEIFINISTDGNVSELIILEGANGGVAIHKTVISGFSELVRNQLAEHPDCTTVYLPSYSQKIVRKVVEILYTGETFYSEEEKKDVNLIWEAMRQLQISFDDKSFYYHPVEYTAVKEEDEEETSQLSVPTAPEEPEVDQTDECWHEDLSSAQKTDYSYCRVVRQPHPENPAKSVYIQSQYGEGRKIQRSMPALMHVNADEIREKEKIDNQREVELLLSKHKPIVIDLLEDDDDDGHPTPKKKRTQTYAAGTPVLRDEGFKNLVNTGKVSLTMVKAATAARVTAKQQQGESSSSLTVKQRRVAKPPSQESSASFIAPHEATFADTERVPAVIIPPNRPEGTGIAFMQKSPVRIHGSPKDMSLSPARTHPEMPKLQPVTQQETTPTRALRVRTKSGDITDIPKLDRNDVTRNDGNFRGQNATLNETDVHGIRGNASSTNAERPTTVAAPAAVVPGSKVNRFLRYQPSAPPSINIKREQSSFATGESEMMTGVERALRKRKAKPPVISYENNEELQRLREEYRKQQEQSSPAAVIVVGSTKKPVPEDVKVDAYVENMGSENENDGNEMDLPINLPIASSSRLLVPRDGPSAVVPSTNAPKPTAPSGRGSTRGKRGGRGGRGGRRGSRGGGS